MLRKLHRIARLENEGLGTAYEYFVKIRALKRLLRDSKPGGVLVYGLPEKHGYSLDLFWQFRDSKIYVYEDRFVRLNKCLELIERLGLRRPEIVKKVDREFDLIISCEAFQRMERDRYMTAVLNYGKRAVIFVPNGDNKSHSRISGLRGYSLKELESLFQCHGGYIDMPPFPPGIRKKGKPNWAHFLVLWVWARIEWLLPFKSKFAHICYVFRPASSR